jgi:O-antigen/teichoic acid export membrane protein
VTLAARAARNTVLVVAARLLSKVLVFVVVLLVIRSMGEENYGKFTSLIVYSALTSIVADLGLRPLFTREVARDRTRLTPYLNTILSLKLLLSVPVLAVLFTAVSIGLPGLVPFVLPTFALLLATSFSNQLRASFYAVGRLRYEAIAIIGESTVLLVGAVAVRLAHADWWWFLWVYAASYGFTVVYCAVVVVRRLGHRFAFDLNLQRLSGLAAQSLPFGLTFIISTLYFKVDVPILKVFTTIAAVGIYSAAYKFLEAITFIPQTLMDPVFPALSSLAQSHPERLQGATTKTYKMLAVIGVPATIGMVVFASPVVRYTIPSFGAAVPVLQVLGLGAFFLFANNTFIYTLNAMGRQSDSTRLAVVSLVINVGLNFALVPQRSAVYGGYMGAAWATVLTEVALFAGGWFMLRRHLYALPIVRSVVGVLAAGAACAVATAGIALGLRGSLLGYLLALVVGGAVYAGALRLTHAFTDEELALAREATRWFRRQPSR